MRPALIRVETVLSWDYRVNAMGSADELVIAKKPSRRSGLRPAPIKTAPPAARQCKEQDGTCGSRSADTLFWFEVGRQDI